MLGGALSGPYLRSADAVGPRVEISNVAATEPRAKRKILKEVEDSSKENHFDGAICQVEAYERQNQSIPFLKPFSLLYIKRKKMFRGDASNMIDEGESTEPNKRSVARVREGAVMLALM